MNNYTEYTALKNKIPQYYKALIRYAFKLTKNNDDAKDLVQDTFYKDYANIDKFTLGTNVRAWLYKILYNQFCTQSRKKSVVKDNFAEYNFGKSTVIKNNMSKAEIIDSIYNLDTKYKIISLLFFTKEFSYSEIKKVTDLKLGTVKSRVYRSRVILRDQIEQRNRNRALLKAV